MFAFPNDREYLDNLPPSKPGKGVDLSYDFSYHNNYPKHVGRLMRKLMVAPESWTVIALQGDSRTIGRIAVAVAASGAVPASIPNIAVIHPTPNGAGIKDVWDMTEKIVSAGGLFAYDGAWVSDHRNVGLPLISTNSFVVRGTKVLYIGDDLTAEVSSRFELAATSALFREFQNIFGDSLTSPDQLPLAIQSLGYGLFDSPSGTQEPDEACESKYFSIDVSSPVFAELADPYKKATELVRLWKAFIASLPARISFTGPLEESLRLVVALGDAYGMGSAVEALSFGVPLADCAAGFSKGESGD